MAAVRWRHVGLLVFLGMGLCSCTAPVGGWSGPYGDFTPYPPPGFAHEVASNAVQLFWNCTRPQPDTLVLEGLAFNPWSASEVRDLEFRLVGVDARGWSLTEAKGEAQYRLLGSMRSTPFQVVLRTSGDEARFDLFYRYYYREPSDTDGGSSGPPHSRLPAGEGPVLLASAGPVLLAQATNTYLMVWNACAETMHRAR